MFWEKTILSKFVGKINYRKIEPRRRLIWENISREITVPPKSENHCMFFFVAPEDSRTFDNGKKRLTQMS